MLIAVLGANGRTGQEVARAAQARGWQVRGLVRDAAAVEPESGMEIVEGDARRAGDVAAVADGADAVISTLGSHSGRLGPLYGPAADAMASALPAAGVRRVVALSTRALGDTADAGDPPDRRPASSPEVHDDLRAMEKTLALADLDVTIMRPARLVAGEPGSYDTRVGKVFPLGRETRRTDLADAMLDAVERGMWIGQDVAIVSEDA